MPGRHKNQKVPVFRTPAGLKPHETYRTTIEKAKRLLRSKLVKLRDPRVGLAAGIEIVSKKNLHEVTSGVTHDDAAQIESSAVLAAFVANDREPDGSRFELAQYFRFRSPHTWARSVRAQ